MDSEKISYEGLWKEKESGVYRSKPFKKEQMPDEFAIIASINKFYHQSEHEPLLTFGFAKLPLTVPQLFKLENGCERHDCDLCIQDMIKKIMVIDYLVTKHMSHINPRVAEDITKICSLLVKYIGE